MDDTDENSQWDDAKPGRKVRKTAKFAPAQKKGKAVRTKTSDVEGAKPTEPTSTSTSSETATSKSTTADTSANTSTTTATATPTPLTFDFQAYRLEQHVEQALRVAWGLTKSQPIGPVDLFVTIGVLPARSKAFAWLQSRFKPTTSSNQPLPDQELDLTQVPVTPSLADALSVAREFFQHKTTIWGRDLVTLMLLADDTALDQRISSSGGSLTALRDDWYRFVISSEQRRDSSVWIRWWSKAGIRTPADRLASSPSDNPSVYLFTWNPKRYPFPEMQRHVANIESGDVARFRWSTGTSSQVKRGDRVFLMRQGSDAPGLVGVGVVDGNIVEDDHWDHKQAVKGRTLQFAPVAWSDLSINPILARADLDSETGEQKLWRTQSGGVEIAPGIVRQLDRLWPRKGRDVQSSVGEPRQWIANFNADRGGGDDSLGVDRYVNAFARVIASRSLQPPLSIGLFGDWGAGKTFFMKRLSKKVDALQSEDTGSSTPHYVNNICQIFFNAWHYAETDLWASLVNTIFIELRHKLDGDTDDPDAFNKVLRTLEIAGELRKDAEERLDAAKTELEKARAKKVAAEAALNDTPLPEEPTGQALREILSESFKEVYGDGSGAVAELLREAATFTGQSEIGDAAAVLGEKRVDDVQSLFTQLSPLVSRGRFWWNVLRDAELPKSQNFRRVAIALVAIPIIGVLVSNFLVGSQVWFVIAELLALLGAVAAWLRSNLRVPIALVDRLDTAQAAVRRRIEEAVTESQDEKLKEFREEGIAHQKAQAAVSAASMALESAIEEEANARKAVSESSSEARLGRFIRERASSSDYEKHLGLIAMIHRDFERLSDLIRSQSEKHDPDLPTIDRIVLYIDDLDRCHPPEKVVRVLEAVHLLLFFPLFVVVVGVDSRWISRSLYKHYEGMLGDESTYDSESSARGERAPAESQDFLEKIFQVPFWLRRMEDGDIQRLIGSLITTDEIEDVSITDDGRQTLAAGDASGGSASANGEPEHEGTATVAGDTSAGEDNARVIGSLDRDESAVDLQANPATPVESLSITRAEVTFMDSVATLMPRTPRSVKRFVNVYRLYKASLTHQELVAFLGTPADPGTYRAVQVLLALVTGTPHFAKAVLTELNNVPGDRRLSDLAGQLSLIDDDWRQTLTAVETFARGGNDLSIGELQSVASLVGRYSVHHMVGHVPQPRLIKGQSPQQR